jgi:transcriptional regulator with PAS, ATPase and Fis domain
VPEQPSLGVLVVDGGGAVRFSDGVATEPAVQSAALALLGKSAESHALRTITVGDRRLVVLIRRSPGNTACFVHESGAEETLIDFVASVDFAFAVLNHFVTNPFEAMTVVDKDALVRFISPVHERFFGLAPGEAFGRPVTEVIENTRMQEVVRTGKAEFGQVQEMRGVSRVVSRVPIRERGRVVGAIGQVMFKGPEQLHDLSRELTRLKTEVAYYKRELSWQRTRTHGLADIVGASAAIRRLKADIVKVAPLDVPVLLVGESGTGKELVSHAIHSLSPRNERPMVLVNAAALPATLVESELFGYEPGAFTGAERKGRKGKFEQADRTTLFLDEIGDMPIEVQAKLLRVLQDGDFERVGGDRVHHSDFRLIAATNRNLIEAVDEKTFRLDLYYRISGVVLRVPALSERPDDIPLLVEHFLASHAERHGETPKRAGAEVLAYLRERSWPGNVRQLRHEVQMAAVFAEGPEIRVSDFRRDGEAAGARAPPTPTPAPAAAQTISRAVAETELSLIREALERHGGNKKRVATELGISRSYLYKRLREQEGGGTDSDEG